MSGIFQLHSRRRVRVLAYQLQAAYVQKDFHMSSDRDPQQHGLLRILHEMLTVVAGMGSDVPQGLRSRLDEADLCLKPADGGSESRGFRGSGEHLLSPLPRAIHIACTSDDYFPTATWLHEVGTPQHGRLVRAHMRGHAVHVAIDLVGHTEGGIPSLWQRDSLKRWTEMDQEVGVDEPKRRSQAMPPPFSLVKLHYLSSPATLFSEMDYDGTITDPVVSAPDLLTAPLPTADTAAAGQRQGRSKANAPFPPWMSKVYRENLVMIPPSFLPAIAQTGMLPLSTSSSPNGSSASTSLERELPDNPLLRDSIVLSAAFNLGTLKLEPTIFTVWMNILARTSFRVKLLIRIRAKPHDLLLRGLETEASARGIHPSRFIFMVEPVSRKGLLELAQVISLALDTRIYGMHSSAMDALNHRIPVLALEGANPASRVSSSVAEGWKRLHTHPVAENETENLRGSKTNKLRASASFPSLLVARSLKEYEDLAVKLVTSPFLLHHLKASLSLPCSRVDNSQKNGSDCADGQNNATARNLEVAYAATLELASLRNAASMARQSPIGRAHIVVAQQERAMTSCRVI